MNDLKEALLVEKDTNLSTRFKTIRQYTEKLCEPLQPEDYVPQPIIDVSPPKWHLGHTTWFFETFVLLPNLEGYQRFDEGFPYIFNSYYEGAGKRIARDTRGNLTRPATQKVYEYRAYVNEHMEKLLELGVSKELAGVIELGLQHEQQHQELFLTDLKYILGINPLFPVFNKSLLQEKITKPANWITVKEGVYEIGYKGDDFCYDNELGVHKVYIHKFEIADQYVTTGEYLEFMLEGGYTDYQHWLSEGWGWVNENGIEAPFYWHKQDGRWFRYTLGGLKPVDPDEPITHISLYEADAFASWKGMRLPTEFEWEVASPKLNHGLLWEWTNSAYLPYPGYKKAEGAIGDYNGKFMVNQKVLRGKSIATSPNHSRPTYRNFFHPHLRWQFTGIRLART